VLEVEEYCGNFEVVSPEYGDPEDENNDDVIVGVDVPRHQQTLHMVNPYKHMCTCGVRRIVCPLVDMPLLCRGFTKDEIWRM
jgi:hypothetical protein